MSRQKAVGFTVLDVAIYLGYAMSIDVLIEAGVGVSDIDGVIGRDQPNGKGNTALMCAAAITHVKALQHLLGIGADPHIKNKDGKTAANMVGTARHASIDAVAKCKELLRVNSIYAKSVIKNGFLRIRSAKKKILGGFSWKGRWIEINSRALVIYDKPETRNEKSRIRFRNITHCQKGGAFSLEKVENKFTFALTKKSGPRTFFQCDNAEDLQDWMSVIGACCETDDVWAGEGIPSGGAGRVEVQLEEPEYVLVQPRALHSTSHVGEPWYVGNGKMGREECKKAVTSGDPGDFLVRDSSDGKKMVMVLCDRGQGETANYQILFGDNQMYIVSGVPYRHVADALQSMRDNHPNGNNGKPLPLGKVANYGQVEKEDSQKDSREDTTEEDDEDESYWTCSKCNCMTEDWPCDVCGADGLWDQRGVSRDVWLSLLAGAPSGTCVVRDSTDDPDSLAKLTVVKSGGGAYFNQRIISAETSGRVQLHGSKHTHDSIESLLKFYQNPMYFAKSSLLDVPSVLIIPSSSENVVNAGHQAFGTALDKALGRAKHKASKSKTLCADGQYRSLWYRKAGTGIQDETFDPDGTRGTLYGNIFDAIDGGTLGQQMMFRRMVSGDTYSNQKFNPLGRLGKTPLMNLTDALKLINKHCTDDLVATGREALLYALQHPHVGTVQRTGGEALTVRDIAALHIYTMDTDFYSRMNQELGGYGKGASHAALADFLPITKLLVDAMQKLPPFPVKLFRGITMNYQAVLGEQIKATDLVKWNQFTSCSTRPDVLKDESFLGEETEGTVFQIMGVTGVNIKAYSKLADEDEVVLPPGSQFVVEKIAKWKFGVNEVRMRQIVPDGMEMAGASKTKTMCSDGTFRTLCYLTSTSMGSSAPLAYTDIDLYMDAENDYGIAADGGAADSDSENDYDLKADAVGSTKTNYSKAEPFKPKSGVQKGKGGAAASGFASATGGGGGGAAESTGTFYSSGLGASGGAAGSTGTLYSSGLGAAIAGADGGTSSDDDTVDY